MPIYSKLTNIPNALCAGLFHRISHKYSHKFGKYEHKFIYVLE